MIFEYIFICKLFKRFLRGYRQRVRILVYLFLFYFTFPLTSFAIWCVLNKTKAVLLFPGFFIGTWGNSSKLRYKTSGRGFTGFNRKWAHLRSHFWNPSEPFLSYQSFFLLLSRPIIDQKITSAYFAPGQIPKFGYRYLQEHVMSERSAYLYV